MRADRPPTETSKGPLPRLDMDGMAGFPAANNTARPCFRYRSTLPRSPPRTQWNRFRSILFRGRFFFFGTLPDALRNLSQAFGQLTDVLGRETASDPRLSSFLAELIPPTLTHRNGHRQVVLIDRPMGNLLPTIRSKYRYSTERLFICLSNDEIMLKLSWPFLI